MDYRSINNNGVIYYKLAPGYEGDTTKNCGLVGSEIDGNFYFLRGYDIKSISYDDELEQIILTRLNGEELYANIDFSKLNFSFNSITGELVITYPNNETLVLTGFTTDANMSRVISTDGTILGEGTTTDPLRLSPVEKTGVYAPAESYMDLTNGEELPYENVNLGRRIVTREYEKNKFGLLYSLSALDIISSELERVNSEWRIPTNDDWNELLNALEPVGFKNHGINEAGEQGLIAGQCLKSIDYWLPNENQQQQNLTNGIDSIGMQVYPASSDDFGKYAILWSSTQQSGGAFIKTLSYNKNTVRQSLASDFYSIRLVKEYNSTNYKELERILGDFYPTILVRIPESNYVKIWTKVNIAVNHDIINALVEDENYINPDLEDYVDPHENSAVYYINEWEGSFWRKKMINEGESIVILEKDGKQYKEWLLKEGQLYDFQTYVETLISQIQNQLANIDTQIKNTVKNYIIGTDNEIYVDEVSDKLKIGFSDDAIFGE